MNQQPDKLFRDKLENYQKTAPAAAWDKIAVSQNKKKPARLWLKIAASLLFAAAAGSAWLIVSQRPTPPSTGQSQANAPANPEDASGRPHPGGATVLKENDQHPIADAATPDKSNDTPKRKIEKQHHHQNSKDEKSSHDVASSGTAHRPGHPANGTTTPRPPIHENDAPAESEVTPYHSHDVALGTSNATAAAFETTTPENKPTVTKAGNVTLTYTTADVSSYLNKSTDDEATTDDQKQSTLKKLLHKANDLTTNQDPFGELRQRKNEILALNFKNDKRGQKTSN